MSISQGIYIVEGSMSVNNDTHIILNDSNLEVDGNFIFRDNTSILLQSISQNLVLYGDIQFQDIILNSNCVIDSDILVKGNIKFIKGIVDIGSNILSLEGILIDERDDSYIYSSSSGGGIEINKSFNNNDEENPGNLGLKINLKNHVGNLAIKRSNMEINYDGNRSVLRTYELEPSVDMDKIEFSYFNHEINNLNTKNFSIWIEDGKSWKPCECECNHTNIVETLSADNVSKITLFSTIVNVGVEFPTGFSPNDDGINDYYVIQGIEKYPNNELVVFNKWGDIIYRSSPYKNDWNGCSTKGVSLFGDDKLIDGTYFYYFFKDKKDKKNVVKGFIEILTK